MRLLLVDDDTLFGAEAQRSLGRAGFVVDWIRSAADLNRSMRSFEYDCVLLDLNLGDAQGKDGLRAIRQHDASLPLIVITARTDRFDCINSLELGADDYKVKPVDLDEVRARVRAVTRRKQLARAGDLVHGELRLQAARRTVTWKGQPVTLTDREFWVLEALVRKKDRVLSRQHLEKVLYSRGEGIDSNAIEVYIHHLRRKLGPALIRTVRGMGYQLGAGPGGA